MFCFDYVCFFSWHDTPLRHTRRRPEALPSSIQGSSRLSGLRALPGSVGHIPSEPGPGCRRARSQTSCHRGRHAPGETGPAPCRPPPLLLQLTDDRTGTSCTGHMGMTHIRHGDHLYNQMRCKTLSKGNWGERSVRQKLGSHQ